jgi:predicted  nucleic acid-binding Zn-ribbon protein
MTTPITASLNVDLGQLEGKLAQAQRAIETMDAKQTSFVGRLRQNETRLEVFDKAVSRVSKKINQTAKGITKGVVGGLIAGELSELGGELGGAFGQIGGAAVAGAIFGGGLPGAIAFVSLATFNLALNEVKSAIRDHRKELKDTLKDFDKNQARLIKEANERHEHRAVELQKEIADLAERMRVETEDLMSETSKYGGWYSGQ